MHTKQRLSLQIGSYPFKYLLTILYENPEQEQFCVASFSRIVSLVSVFRVLISLIN